MALGLLKRKPAEEEPQEQTALESLVPVFCRGVDQRPCVTLCAPTGTCTCDCEEVRRALEEEIGSRGLDVRVGAMKVGCDGVCPYGPLVGFPRRGFFYQQLSPERAKEVVTETLEKGHILFDLLHVDPLHSTSGRILFDQHSGFIATIDDSFCMVQVARYFLEFDQGVSCGKCVPCRVGCVRLREMLDGIITGESRPEDLNEMTAICEAMRLAAHCNYGAFGAGPVAATLKYFRSEFESHIEEQVCRTGGCERLAKEKED